MKLSFKIPKGVSEESLQSLHNALYEIQLQPKSVEITKRMAHINMDDYNEHISPEVYAEDCIIVVKIVTDFITQNTYGE